MLRRRHQHPAARGAIKLGHDQPGHPGHFLEHIDLLQSVLAIGGIQHQHDIVRGFGVEPAQNTADFGQLFHQLALVVEPPGSIDDQRVDTLCGSRLDRIEHHCRWIAAFWPAHQLYANPVCPDRQLLDRGGAKSIACRQHHRIVQFLKIVRQLGDGGGLARTVDADHQDHLRARKGHNIERFGHRTQYRREFFGHRLLDRGFIGAAFKPGFGQLVANASSGARAKV